MRVLTEESRRLQLRVRERVVTTEAEARDWGPGKAIKLASRVKERPRAQE